MTILAAIKREERKLEKELKNLQNKLDGIRSAAKALATRPPRSEDRQEACVVGRWKSKDCGGS
jgi:hypothetical protein